MKDEQCHGSSERLRVRWLGDGDRLPLTRILELRRWAHVGSYMGGSITGPASSSCSLEPMDTYLSWSQSLRDRTAGP